MRHRYIGNLLTATCTVESDPPETSLIHFVQYHAGTKARAFEQVELGNMISKTFIDLAQIASAWQVLFALKEDGTISFCVEYLVLCVITVQYLYRLPRKEEYIDF